MKQRIRKSFKQFLALVLCVAMLLSFVPASVFVRAAGTEGGAGSKNQLSEAELDKIKDLYPGGDKSSVLEYDCGKSLKLGGGTSYLIVVENTNANHFAAFQENLAEDSYVLKAENSIASKTEDANLFASYLSEDGSYKLYTYYTPAYGEARIIVDTQKETVEGYQYEAQAGVQVEPLMVMWGLSMSKTGYDIDETMTADQQKQRNCGAMFVIRMPDNSLFVQDGGDIQQWDDATCELFLNFCRELTGTAAGEKMVINTWMISHAHRDHFNGFYRFLNIYHDQFDLKNVMYNIDGERQGTDYDITGALKMVRTHFPEARYYKPHTGEIINIAGVRLDIMYAPEDRYVPNDQGLLITDDENVGGTYRDYMYSDASTLTSNFNDTSVVFRATFENGVDAIFYADMGKADQMLLEAYADTMIQADIVTVPHHGFDWRGDRHAALMQGANAQAYLYPQRQSAVYGPDNDADTEDLYGTFHKTLRTNFLAMFPDYENGEYDILWQGQNTVTIDLAKLAAGASDYYTEEETPEVEYTGWYCTDPSSDYKDPADRLISMSDPVKYDDLVARGTYNFCFEPVTDSKLKESEGYLIMHAQSGNIMSYNPVSLDPGRPNMGTSLVEIPDVNYDSYDGNAGNGYILYNSKIYFDHNLLNNTMWIFHQEGKSSGNNFANLSTSIKPLFGGSAVYEKTSLMKGVFGDAYSDSLTGHWWYAQSGQDNADPLVQYRYLNPRYNDSGWVTFEPVSAKSGYNGNNYRIEYLSTTNGVSEFLIYWTNGTKCNFLTCDENGNWGIKVYSSVADAKSDLASLKLRLYSFDTWNTAKKLQVTADATVFNIEQGTTLDQLLKIIHDEGGLLVENRDNLNYLDIPTSKLTLDVIGSYHLIFDKQYDPSAKGYCQYKITVKFSENKGADTTLVVLTVNVYDREFTMTGPSRYQVKKGTTEDALKATIAESIQVKSTFSNAYGTLPEQTIAYSASPEGGKYWLEFDSPFDSSDNGHSNYYVNVNYRRTDGSDVLVKTLAVFMEEQIESVSVPVKHGLAMVNAGLDSVLKDLDGNDLTIMINGTPRKVSLGMLTLDGEYIDSSKAAEYTGLTLTYAGEVICNDFELEVTESDPSFNYPAKGEPGYVGTDKVGTTTQAAFSQSGVANIQLSANGVPVEKGVDIIVVMDLSGSMLYSTGVSTNAANYQDTRIYALENSLKEMIKTLQASGTDVRIAMSDFGDLDHFELAGSRVDATMGSHSVFDVDFNNSKFASALEFPSQLSYVFSANDPNTHNPFCIHETKFNQAVHNYTGGVRPTVYTGSGKVGVEAFVNVNSLYDGQNFTSSMNRIISKLDDNVRMDIGTNYDIGLEYAYHLGDAIQQDNIARGADREVVCIFMSDGGPMQYNYFSGVSSTSAWIDWITGRIDSLASAEYSETNMPEGMDTMMSDLMATLKNGYLTRPEYRRGPWSHTLYKLENGSYKSSGQAINDAANGYFIYRDRFANDTDKSFFDYMDSMGYYLDWDYLTRIAFENGIYDFDYEYYKNNPLMSELVDLFLDKEFIGYENAGSGNYIAVYRTKLKNPSYSTEQYYVLDTTKYNGDDFYEAMRSMGVELTWDLFSKIVYKNRGKMPEFSKQMGYPYASGAGTSDKEKAGENAIKAFNAKLREIPSGYTHATLSANAHFYNAEGKNWWAEAIKGNTNELYPVINKYAYGDSPYAYNGDVEQDYQGKTYMSGFRGLGIDIYSVSFSLADDKLILESDAVQILQRISSNNGSNGSYFFAANSQDELTNALNAIAATMGAGATNAYYTDTLGDNYELYYGQVEGVDIVPAIKVMERTSNGTIIREIITFADKDGDGVMEAYSDLVYTMTTVDGISTKVYNNIWLSNGLIQGKYVIYNTNTISGSDTGAVDLYLDDTGRKFVLDAETFFWTIGKLGKNEMVLEYQVYLTGSMDGTLQTNGKLNTYLTNKQETLTYVNYLGNICTLDPPSPKYSWQTGMGGSLSTDKTVSATDKPDEFELTLEAFANSATSQIATVKPADIVLALDQSSSMYTPLGWNKDRVDLENGDTNVSINAALTDYAITDFVSQANTAGSDVQENAKRLGYYIAVHNNPRENYIYLVHYAQNSAGQWAWYYVSLDQTTRSIDLTISDYDNASNDSTLNGADYKLCTWGNTAFTGFSYYKTQYGALIESVESFVEGLKLSGVDHRVSIVGFASPFYDGWDHYDGSGLYIDGNFYLYDTDFMYKGTQSGGSITYTEKGFVEQDWTGNVILDPDKTFTDMDPTALSAAELQQAYANSIICKDANGNPTGQTMYGQALAYVNTDDGYSSILNSIAAINANYQQTCPAVGIEMAENIFAARGDEGVSRDKIVVLFTDGVPTVRMYSNREHGFTDDQYAKALYWSVSGGVEDALDRAQAAKENGVEIYTVGTAAMQNSLIGGTNINSGDFLSMLSSNYSGVSYQLPGFDMIQQSYSDYWNHQFSTNADGGEGADKDPDPSNPQTSDRTRYYSYYDGTGENLWTYYYRVVGVGRSSSNFAMFATANGEGNDLNVAFGTIMESITVPTVSLDASADLRDVLSEYFQLVGNDTSAVTVYTAPFNPDGTVGEMTLLKSASVRLDKTDKTSDRFDIINVSGYDYHAEYYSAAPREKDGAEYYGSKLIVKIRVEAREGFWGGNNVPTNAPATGVYDNDGTKVQEFPIPEANVPVKPVISAKDQVVYYGDTAITAMDLIDSIAAGNVAVTFDVASGKFIPAESWMDDYAIMSWTSGLSNDTTSINTVKSGDYTFGVTLKPRPVDADTPRDGVVNMTQEGGSIAGTPVVSVSSDTDTGSVDILVPVITYQDSTIAYGDGVNADYYNANNFMDSIIWVNKDDPYGLDPDAYPIVPSVGFDTAPQLTLEYSKINGAGEYFTEDFTVDVQVSIGDRNITGETYFRWISCDSELHDEHETPTSDRNGGSVIHKGTTDSHEFTVHLTCILKEDTIVIDFGIGVDISVLLNDILPEGVTLEAVMLGDELPDVFTTTLSDAFNNSVNCGVGAMSVADGKLQYTLSNMQMKQSVKFIYAVKYVSGDTVRYYYSSVTVIPATIIYYEDSFVKLEVVDGPGNVIEGENWESVGQTQDKIQDEDRPGEDLLDALESADMDSIYGYDSNYTNMAEYSLGSAAKITVSSGTAGKASFSFWGTAFDVISLSCSDTGTIVVKITDANGDYVANYLVDTYYGYKFEDGKWIVDTDASDNALYQIPVIKADLKEYGYYNVEIVASYGALFDHQKDGSYDFYLDAIRIYNPADTGENDAIIKDAYIADGEFMPTYEELRNQLISKENFDSLNSNEVGGAIFIDGNANLSPDNANGGSEAIAGLQKPGVVEYANYGPNNELYLAPGQAVAFQLNSVANLNQVHLALKSVGGSAEITIYGVKNSTKSYVLNDQKVNTATDLYYNISSLIGQTVVISNTGSSGMLSITNIKSTYNATQTQSYSLLSVSNLIAEEALASLEGEKDPMLGEGTIAPQTATMTYEDEILLNIYFKLDGIQADLADMGLLIFSADGNTALDDINGATAVDGQYVVTTKPIAAKNLGDTVYFRIYAKQADGSYVYSKLLSYSPKQYATNILNNSNDEAMKALVVAMLNYGAEAQKYFNYNTENLVNACLTEAQKALAPAYSADMLAPLGKVDSAKVGEFAANGGFGKKYPTVSLEGAFAINYYLENSYAMDNGMKLYYWNAEDYAAAEVLTAENATGIIDGNTIGGIAAKDLDSTIYVAAVYESNGVRYCTGVLPYSVGAFCASNGSALAQAIAVYGCCAKAYFA